MTVKGIVWLKIRQPHLFQPRSFGLDYQVQKDHGHITLHYGEYDLEQFRRYLDVDQINGPGRYLASTIPPYQVEFDRLFHDPARSTARTVSRINGPKLPLVKNNLHLTVGVADGVKPVVSNDVIMDKMFQVQLERRLIGLGDLELVVF